MVCLFLSFDYNILILEKLESPAKESSGVFNNAGTGHAANCELNYTPIDNRGNINVEKALMINNSFEKSLQFWASLYQEGKIDISKFLKFVPHISFVTGGKNVEFLHQDTAFFHNCRNSKIWNYRPHLVKFLHGHH